jgi:ankyrin repeat protein
VKPQLIAIAAAMVLVGCGPSASERALLAAARKGHIEAVKQHLDSGVNVNAKRTGSTPMHQAAYYGQKEVAELLIAKGADVNAKDENGQPPLV